MKQPYKLALMGFGNVGQNLLRLLLDKKFEMQREFGIDWQLTGITTRRLGWLVNPNGLDVSRLLSDEFSSYLSSGSPTNLREWLAMAQPDVVFETTSLEPQTGQPAIEHLKAALDAGAHIITANKGPLIHAYRELSELAANKGKQFRFEAVTMAGVPFYSLFRETLPLVKLQRFRGVLNSTTTVVLEAIGEGSSFEEAVRNAQQLGIAETDPSNDLDGWDAAVKLVIIATVLFKLPIRLTEVNVKGIRGLKPSEVKAAQQTGWPYKLVSYIEQLEGGQIQAMVQPEMIGPQDPLAAARGSSLLAHFEMDLIPGLTITEHNFGPATTAYDMLSDFINITRRS